MVVVVSSAACVLLTHVLICLVHVTVFLVNTSVHSVFQCGRVWVVGRGKKGKG